MKVRVDIELTEDDWRRLTREAYVRGFSRVEPRNSWSESEKKDMVRFLVRKMILEKLPGKAGE